MVQMHSLDFDGSEMSAGWDMPEILSAVGRSGMRGGPARSTHEETAHYPQWTFAQSGLLARYRPVHCFAAT